jgi:RimJ/RimL family protein N-acetyltransferase
MNNQKPKIIIETERLLLRTWTPSDVPLMALISANPVVMEHFPKTQDIKATEKLIIHINEHYNKYGYAAYAVEIKKSGEFIGFVGLNHPSFDILNFIPKGLPIVEIGWRLSLDHWGKGYATEAAKAVLDYAFTVLNLDEIISFTTIGNVKSRRVMEKVGLHYDETDDFDHPLVDEKSVLRRHVLYRLTRNDFSKQGLYHNS